MNKQSIKTIIKSIIIIFILLAIVFALRAPAADLNYFDDAGKLNYMDENGLPYFSEMDSYYNLRLTENFIDHGYVGDIKYDNGTQMDMHRTAPDGMIVNYQLGIVYVTSFLHSIADMFGSYSVKEVAFWTGAIIASLAVIPAFIFARRITNTYGAIVATLLIGLAPNYFAHTFPGFFDTDMFYYIFSLFFMLFFVEAIRTDNNILKVIFAILSIISIGLFSQAWTGYVFYIAVVALFVIVYLIAKFILKIETDDKSKYSNRIQWIIHDKDFLTIVFLVVISLIGFSLVMGVDGLFSTFTGYFNSLTSLQSASSSTTGNFAFPNVLISISEMQVPSLLGAGMGSAFLANNQGVVNGIGGIAVLFAALFALYTLIKKGFKLKKFKLGSSSKAKPRKSERKSASKVEDDKFRFRFNLSDLGNFNSKEELYTTRRTNLIYTSLFVCWLFASIVACSQGSRFITTIVLPVSFLTGIFVGYITDFFKNRQIKDYLLMAIFVICGFLIAYPFTQIYFVAAIIIFLAIVIIGAFSIYGVKNKFDGIGNFKKYLAVALIIFALITPTVCGAYMTSNQVVPGNNDAFWNSMVWINENCPEDTVISSWWDFGYLFEIAADRQTTADGGSQYGERAMWLGKAMTTDDLELSAGIFRMINTEGTNANTYLAENMSMDNGKATNIICEILPLKASDAKNTLISNYSFTEKQANDLIKYTHPDNPRPTIFVASADMLKKASWWTYFGSWNFDNQNSTHYQYYVPDEQCKTEEYGQFKVNLFNESGVAGNVIIDRSNNTTATTETINNLNNSQIYINDTKYNPIEIGHIMVVENGSIIRNESVDNQSGDANYTMLLMGYHEFDENGSDKNNSVMFYTPILIHKELVNSMFTRLFLLGGSGQNIFTQIHSESGISLWQVNFNNTVAGGNSASTSSSNNTTN